MPPGARTAVLPVWFQGASGRGRGRGSNHGRGRAADIIVPGASDEEVARFARDGCERAEGIRESHDRPAVKHRRPGTQVFCYLQLGFDPLWADAANLNSQQIGKGQGFDFHGVPQVKKRAGSKPCSRFLMWPSAPEVFHVIVQGGCG